MIAKKLEEADKKADERERRAQNEDPEIVKMLEDKPKKVHKNFDE
jgi:hypothetical protein